MYWKKEHPDAIYFFGESDEKYGVFSNFYPLNKPLVYEGKEYKTTEHLFQALKFLHKDSQDIDHEYAEIIRKQNKPYSAKIIAGQRVKSPGVVWMKPLNSIILKYQKSVKIRSDWEEFKYEAMLIFLRLKFQDPEFRKVLLSTKDKVICEDSPYDNIWGIGSKGNGTNLLGKALMQVRKEIQENKEDKTEPENEHVDKLPIDV